MRYLDLTLPTAAENLALDESLLDEAEAGNAPGHGTPQAQGKRLQQHQPHHLRTSSPGCAQQTDFIGDGCPATSAILSGPNGVVSVNRLVSPCTKLVPMAFLLLMALRSVVYKRSIGPDADVDTCHLFALGHTP